ncbi:hypothetical protein [Rhizobium terrae]|uniref:hypothetical protein n=1 Tax=Rhizobium terrae TaxID=2171756 RepID=UPI000E3D8B72|nr:hypothetical protein [Rhizobium terrae]
MASLVRIANVLAFGLLFFQYAVMMKPPEPAGTRRFLQIYSKQLPTGAYPTLKPVWELGAGWVGAA